MEIEHLFDLTEIETGLPEFSLTDISNLQIFDGLTKWGVIEQVSGSSQKLIFFRYDP